MGLWRRLTERWLRERALRRKLAARISSRDILGEPILRPRKVWVGLGHKGKELGQEAMGYRRQPAREWCEPVPQVALHVGPISFPQLPSTQGDWYKVTDAMLFDAGQGGVVLATVPFRRFADYGQETRITDQQQVVLHDLVVPLGALGIYHLE